MSQTLSLAKRNKIQKLTAKQDELLAKIKEIQAKPIRSTSGTRSKSDKIKDLKRVMNV